MLGVLVCGGREGVCILFEEVVKGGVGVVWVFLYYVGGSDFFVGFL